MYGAYEGLTPLRRYPLDTALTYYLTWLPRDKVSPSYFADSFNICSKAYRTSFNIRSINIEPVSNHTHHRRHNTLVVCASVSVMHEYLLVHHDTLPILDASAVLSAVLRLYFQTKYPLNAEPETPRNRIRSGNVNPEFTLFTITSWICVA
jgi:hypothetical protein